MNPNVIPWNRLRILEVVYRHQSVSTAATELGLTQSGVSQHIQGLEETLGLKLFDRVARRIIPTGAASELVQSISPAFSRIEAKLEHLLGERADLTGEIRVGVPIEFGNNVFLPHLAEFSRRHPRVHFSLTLGFAIEMNARLLSGELDFAIIDEFPMDKAVVTRPIYDERLELVAHIDLMKNANLKDIGNIRRRREKIACVESLPFADYQPGAPLLRRWFWHHLKARGAQVVPKIIVMDVQAMGRLVEFGLVAGILPSHFLSRLPSGSSLRTINISTKPLINGIRLAHVRDRTLTRPAVEFLKWLQSRWPKI